jgi:hypothetical protein
VRYVVTTVLLLTGVVGCSSQDEDAEVGDPQTLIDDALTNMVALESYRMDMAFSPEGQDIEFFAEYDNGKYYEYLGEPETSNFTELVLADGGLYVRFCEDDECEPWDRHEHTVGVPSLGGLTTTAPETMGLAAVQLGREWTVSTHSGSSATLKTDVDLAEVIQANQRSVLRDAGFSEEEIEAAIQEQFESDVSAEPAVEMRLDVVVDLDEKLIMKVTLTAPEGEDGETDEYFHTVYSRYNDVSVEVPEEYEDFDPCDIEIPTSGPDFIVETFAPCLDP